MLITSSNRWVPAFGTGILHMSSGLRLHRVDDRHVGLALKGDLDHATEGAPWWACVAFAQGRIAIVPSAPSLAPLPTDWRQKLVEVVVVANREIHHSGHWVTFASSGELGALWRDWAGDMQFCQSWPDPWERLKAKPQVEWVDTLDACWTEWEVFTRDARDPRHEIMRAQGEKSKARPPR